MDADRPGAEAYPRDGPTGASGLRHLVFALLGSEPPATSLAELVVSEIMTAVREFLGTNPAFPPAALITASALRIHLLRRCGFLGSIGSLDEKVVRGITKAVVEHYQQRPEIVERRERRRARVAAGREIPLDTITEVRDVFHLEELKWLGTLAGGRSGSTVLKVYIRERPAKEAVGVLKLTREQDDYQRERRGYDEAHGDWLRHWVAEKPLACECSSGLFALLSRLAFPPDATGDDSDSLEVTILRGQRARSTAVVSELGRAYSSHLPDADRKDDAPSDFVRQLVRHWPGTIDRRIWSEEDLWTIVGLPGPRTPAFLDGGVLRWNPLWLLNRGIGQPNEKRVYFHSLQHGDLNARNVLLRRRDDSPASGCLVQLIDLEKAERTSSLLDICWLTLWIIVASGSRVPRASATHWALLPQRLVGAVIEGQQDDEELGSLQLGVDLASVLAHDVREMPRAFTDNATKGFWENRINDQLRLTLTITALVMTYYEARNLERAFDEGEDTESSENQLSVLWAVTFFRIAAIALKEYGEGLPDGGQAPDVWQLVKELTILS